MANVNCVIVNPTGTAFANINAANEDVPAYTVSDVVVLSDAEMATFTAAHDDDVVILIANASTGAVSDATRRLAAKMLALGKHPGKSTDEGVLPATPTA